MQSKKAFSRQRIPLELTIPRKPWVSEPAVRKCGSLRRHWFSPNGQTQADYPLFTGLRSDWAISKSQIKSSNVYWAGVLCQTLKWVSHDLSPQGSHQLAGEAERQTTSSHLLAHRVWEVPRGREINSTWEEEAQLLSRLLVLHGQKRMQEMA